MSYSQSFLHVRGGMMNYGGDLQDQLFTFNQSNSSFGLGIDYKLSRHITMSANYSKGKLASDAKLTQNYSVISVLFEHFGNELVNTSKSQ